MAGTTITIANEGDKLIIVRKPVLPTRRERLCGCGCQILVVVFAVGALLGWGISVHEDAFYAALLAIIITAIVVGISIIRNRYRNPKPVHPPDYDDEVLTFDTNQFEVRYRGVVHAFSYRFDTRPVLRQNTYSTYEEVIIPCNPLYDHVPEQFRWGFYCIWAVDNCDAEHIFLKLKEHLESVKSLEK